MNWFIELQYRNGLTEKVKFPTRDAGRDFRRKQGAVKETGTDYDVVRVSDVRRVA